MEMSRRTFLATSAAAAGAGLLTRTGLGQTATAPAALPVPDAKTPAALAVRKRVGNAAWTELFARLRKTNSDIEHKGLKTLRGVANAGGQYLTGYPYTEFYDWDLYFENVYLSYFGVFPY